MERGIWSYFHRQAMHARARSEFMGLAGDLIFRLGREGLPGGFGRARLALRGSLPWTISLNLMGHNNQTLVEYSGEIRRGWPVGSSRVDTYHMGRYDVWRKRREKFGSASPDPDTVHWDLRCALDDLYGGDPGIPFDGAATDRVLDWLCANIDEESLDIRLQRQGEHFTVRCSIE